MMKLIAILFVMMYGAAVGEPPVNGIRASNVLGGAEQHASFSFIRPGLTQTSYAFNGPSSHQSFSSSIGNPHLAQRVLPNVANALAYRNPGLGYFPSAPVSTGYANSLHGVTAPNTPVHTSPYPGSPAAFSYQQQAPLDQATALAYLQQYQQQYQPQIQNVQSASAQQTYNSEIGNGYQAQLGQLFALRQQQALLQFQAQANAQHQQEQQQQTHGHQRQAAEHIPVHETSQEVPEQVQLQQQVQQPTQNLLGVAYSSAPSVAHVKVSGNGYKFNF